MRAAALGVLLFVLPLASPAPADARAAPVVEAPGHPLPAGPSWIVVAVEVGADDWRRDPATGVWWYHVGFELRGVPEGAVGAVLPYRVHEGRLVAFPMQRAWGEIGRAVVGAGNAEGPAARTVVLVAMTDAAAHDARLVAAPIPSRDAPLREAWTAAPDREGTDVQLSWHFESPWSDGPLVSRGVQVEEDRLHARGPVLDGRPAATGSGDVRLTYEHVVARPSLHVGDVYVTAAAGVRAIDARFALHDEEHRFASEGVDEGTGLLGARTDALRWLALGVTTATATGEIDLAAPAYHGRYLYAFAATIGFVPEEMGWTLHGGAHLGPARQDTPLAHACFERPGPEGACTVEA